MLYKSIGFATWLETRMSGTHRWSDASRLMISIIEIRSRLNPAESKVSCAHRW